MSKKKMSLKQIEANRRNAQKSTGPRTAPGRAVSKMNALKHGILSRQVLVRGRAGRENPREFTRLHRRFCDALQPVGPVEEMLVDQIVTAHWRLRRALVAEAGAIALNVEDGRWTRSQGLHPELQWLEWEAFGDPIPRMDKTSLGNGVLEGWLREVRAAVERDGELTEAATKIPFHGRPNRLTQELEALRARLASPPENVAGEALRERNRREALALLDRKLRQLAWRQAACVAHETDVEQARQAAEVLPPAAELDKILRYETKLERQMYRAMAQLERVQRMRLGEVLPAPFAVEVSERL